MTLEWRASLCAGFPLPVEKAKDGFQAQKGGGPVFLAFLDLAHDDCG